MTAHVSWIIVAAYRDSVMFKTAYAWGLRRNEVRHLQTVDFARNPHAREFGQYGVLHVRFGKAMRGSPPKPRAFLPSSTGRPTSSKTGCGADTGFKLTVVVGWICSFPSAVA